MEIRVCKEIYEKVQISLECKEARIIDTFFRLYTMNLKTDLWLLQTIILGSDQKISCFWMSLTIYGNIFFLKCWWQSFIQVLNFCGTLVASADSLAILLLL